MNKALKYLESVTQMDVDQESGDSFENISLPDAITACKIQELQTLEKIINWAIAEERKNFDGALRRIEELTKELRNIKIIQQ